MCQYGYGCYTICRLRGLVLPTWTILFVQILPFAWTGVANMAKIFCSELTFVGLTGCAKKLVLAIKSTEKVPRFGEFLLIQCSKLKN